MVEPLLCSVTLTSLFAFNLYEHQTGYIGPPCIDTFGCVNNVMLSTLLYKIRYRREQQQGQLHNTGKVTPEMFTITMTLLSLALLFVGFGKIQLEQVATRVASVPVGLYVVVTMGRLSWKKSNDHIMQQHNGNPTRLSMFQLWKLSCVFLIAVVVGVEVEPSLCHLSPIISRTYHSVFLHIIISALFGCVSECAFRLIENEDVRDEKKIY